ncbi:hypothetical protein F418_p39 [Hafnia phage Enc34]|uniref:Uncharacterized protein n=1 Tax=Hafnia phage Enc34 TaxID=1150990 RepID=H6WYK1_9CAUD|nr:hypothetical protein F418_p39 [Hafnia phage Enc34]AFB84056.1 hypothetical protein [Hafnia phage Enc34]
MARLAEQHVIPHFKFNGGVWYCFREFDNEGKYPNYFPVKHAKLYYSVANMEKLVSAYRWWKSIDKENARMTDAMLLRHASAYRFWDLHGRKRFDIVGKSDVFMLNPGSIFTAEYISYVSRRCKNVKGGKSRIAPEMIPALIASGYRRTSNKHHRVTRIDREDWKEVLAVDLEPHDPLGSGMARAHGYGMGDHYRRCYSNDSMVIDSDYLFKLFPGSDEGPDCFVPWCEEI